MEEQCVATTVVPLVEEVGVPAEQRSTEELIRFLIPDGDGRYFLVGSSLGMAERKEMCDFLMRNIKVFAWTLQEMPGVDPTFAVHALNVDPSKRPMVQKVRRSSAAHVEAVMTEVDQLLKAGAIREVLYPTWLANPVVVPKKNGKLRVCVDYTNLNDACPMDRFPLPRIEQMVDATAGCEHLSFMDTYRGYHQIALAPKDQENTAFISPRGTYCYKVVPFGLKNAGATSNAPSQICFLLRLNAEKCAFGVSLGKFLGYIVSRRGIEANPTQILAVQNLRALTIIKEVQRLTGMVAALNRFIQRLGDLCHPFFRVITISRRKFVWTGECEQALQSLKQYLSHAPLLVKPLPDEDLYLYLAVSDHANSAVLVQKEGMEHQPIFYSSKTMMDSQTRRGQCLATAAEEARIQDKEVLEEPCSRPTEPLRARDTLGHKKLKRQWRLFSGDAWRMTVDGASNVHGAGAGIVLVSPSGTVHESVVSIGYPATNNEAENESLIAGLQLALLLDADSVHIFCDSQLIVGHLNDDYQAKDQRMNAYVSHVLVLFQRFGRVEVEWIAWEHNAHADALAGLASVYRTSGSRTIVFDEVAKPSFEQPCQLVMAISLGPSQLDPVIDYLKNQVLPPNKRDAYKIRCRATNFFLDPNDNLYRRTFTGPDLRVVHEDHVKTVLEELHSGSCGAHFGGRSLAQRALTQGYWWSKMVKQSEEYVKRCVRCQLHVSLIHQPAFPLKMIISPWPFAVWGFDIVGKMPKAPGGFEYMLTVTDLFTKWVEASPLVKTTAGDVERFIWKHIISRFGAEASNKTITRGFKRRLDRKLDKWVEELPHVLWAYRTTPRRSTGHTPFAMAYGMEAVLPLSTMIPTARTENFKPVDNNALVGSELDFAEELRDNTNLRHAAYQQEVARGYN
ncbi:uncharacterized protein LOC131328449 [Rhododendron vialii]|uniref:uncharacterized protein LOC131328449 n=1 Tax=Rhododendron vialii TaxID=182163 RepID=UPI00265D8029|nr:uncharacterized protein LOC131328449 [Rhododendron vialii]